MKSTQKQWVNVLRSKGDKLKNQNYFTSQFCFSIIRKSLASDKVNFFNI